MDLGRDSLRPGAALLVVASTPQEDHPRHGAVAGARYTVAVAGGVPAPDEHLFEALGGRKCGRLDLRWHFFDLLGGEHRSDARWCVSGRGQAQPVRPALAKATRSNPYALTKDLILAYTNIPGGVTSASVDFQIQNPSVLLHLTIQIFARPANLQAGNNGHDYTGETWQLFTAAQGTPDVQLNPVFFDAGVPTPRSLPDAYETETGTKLVNGVVVLQKNAGNPSDAYVLRCIWEPAHPLLMQDNDLLVELQAGCTLPKITSVNISS